MIEGLLATDETRIFTEGISVKIRVNQWLDTYIEGDYSWT